MDEQVLLDRIQDLTDLELAVLLSLIAQQHCIIETGSDTLDDLAAELALVRSIDEYHVSQVAHYR